MLYRARRTVEGGVEKSFKGRKRAAKHVENNISRRISSSSFFRKFWIMKRRFNENVRVSLQFLAIFRNEIMTIRKSSTSKGGEWRCPRADGQHGRKPGRRRFLVEYLSVICTKRNFKSSSTFIWRKFFLKGPSDRWKRRQKKPFYKLLFYSLL